jgi:hypothetical protein
METESRRIKMLYESWIGEMETHYRTTGNPEIPERAEGAINAYIGFLRGKVHQAEGSELPIGLEGLTNEKITKIQDALSAKFS